jgi:hypothetical protein
MSGADEAGATAEGLYLGAQDNGSFGTTNAGVNLPTWINRDCCDVHNIAASPARVFYTVCCGLSLVVRTPDLLGGGLITTSPTGSVVGFRIPDALGRFAANGYVAVTSSGVFITTDITTNPITWTQLGAATSPATPRNVYVAVSAGTPTFYVQTGNGNGITPDPIFRFVGTNAAGAWQQVSPPNNAGGFGVFAVDPNDPNRLLASHLSATSDPEMIRSTNGGATWNNLPALDNLMTGGGAFRYQNTRGPAVLGGFAGIIFRGYPMPSLVAFDPEDARILLAGGAESGLFLSLNDGATWELVSGPSNRTGCGMPHLPRPSFAYFDHEGSGSLESVLNVYVGTQGRGVWRLTRRETTNLTASFAGVYTVGDNGAAQPNGIAGYDLLSGADQVLSFDYDADGKQDLFLYRPGRGAAWVAHSNGDGTFSGVYTVGDNGAAQPNGIAGYDLLSKDDRVLAFDYDGDGKQDLFLYRPGRGAAWVAHSNGDGTFSGVYTVGDNGAAQPNGIAGYDLLSKEDQVLAFDYDGDGKQDLFLYRPGRGAAWVAHSNGDGTFTAVLAVGDNGSAPPNGIAGYDLLSTRDQVLAFDYDGDGRQDLFLYRPGGGAAWVARSNGDGTFTSVFAVGDNGSAPPNGIAGYDLLSTRDRVLAFDYDGDGRRDLLLYRPKRGAAWVARSNWDGTFTAVYSVGDNGAGQPNGIAGYDLLSVQDRVLAFDYNGDCKQDLFLYRPTRGAAWVARPN